MMRTMPGSGCLHQCWHRRQHYTAEGKEKQGYPNATIAKAEALEQSTFWGRRMRAYRCKICRLWHVGRLTP